MVEVDKVDVGEGELCDLLVAGDGRARVIRPFA